jgi:hypothetical protein
MFKGLDKNISDVSSNTEYQKEIKIIRRNQIEILELKSIVTKMKIFLLGFNHGLEQLRKNFPV